MCRLYHIPPLMSVTSAPSFDRKITMVASQLLHLELWHRRHHQRVFCVSFLPAARSVEWQRCYIPGPRFNPKPRICIFSSYVYVHVYPTICTCIQMSRSFSVFPEDLRFVQPWLQIPFLACNKSPCCRFLTRPQPPFRWCALGISADGNVCSNGSNSMRKGIFNPRESELQSS